MKGRELTVEEVLKLEDGTKVWVDDLFEIHANQICIKKNLKLYFTENAIHWFLNMDEDLSRIKIYEWKEVVKVKEYQTWEVIKMLSENPKLEFKSEKNRILKVNKYNEMAWEDNDEAMSLRKLVITFKWTLVKKPVSFMEAMQALHKNKKVYCVINNIRYDFRINGSGVLFDNDGAICIKQILEGEWFIGEDDEIE